MEILNLFGENGSHSEIETSGCDNKRRDGYRIPARSPAGTVMNFYLRLWVCVRIFIRILFTVGRVIALPNTNLTRCHC
jgi:hypothetical protein